MTNSTTKTTKTTKTQTPKTPDKWATVKDDGRTASGEILWGLVRSQSDYLARVSVQGPILAKRIHSGEKAADIARALIAAAAAEGKKISMAAAEKHVSRYKKVGEAILDAKKGDDIEAVIAKASAANRGAGKRGPGKKTGGEKTGRTLRQQVEVASRENAAVLKKAGEGNIAPGILRDDLSLFVASLEASLNAARKALSALPEAPAQAK